MKKVYIASIAGLVGGTILSTIPSDTVMDLIQKGFFSVGVALTLGMSKWSLTAGAWNSRIEPMLIDHLDKALDAAAKGLVKGLRSD